MLDQNQATKAVRYCRTLLTSRLKELWDRYDGSDEVFDPEPVTGEAVHQVLNERGEGAYCAV